MEFKKTIKRAYLNTKIQDNYNSELKFKKISKSNKEKSNSDYLMKGGVLIVENYIQNRKLEKQLSKACGIKFDEIETMHQDFTPNQLMNHIIKYRSSIKTLVLQNKIIKDFAKCLSFKDIFIELEPNIRFQPPYDYVKKNEVEIEKKIGTGQLTPHTVHKDSWFHHPKNTLNIWIALTDVNKYSGMSILENSQNYYPKTNNQELIDFIDAKTNEHIVLNLKKGDAVIFLAELMHGSIINQKNETRGTLSMRFSTEPPKSQQSIKYWYEKYDSLKNKLVPLKSDDLIDFNPKDLEEENEKKDIDPSFKKWDNNSIFVLKKGELQKFPRRCPHKGVDLLCGSYDANDNKIICPSHRLGVKCKTE